MGLSPFENNLVINLRTPSQLSFFSSLKSKPYTPSLLAPLAKTLCSAMRKALQASLNLSPFLSFSRSLCASRSPPACLPSQPNPEPHSGRTLSSLFDSEEVSEEAIVNQLLSNQHDPKAALKYFNSVKVSDGFVGNDLACVMLNILIQSGSKKKASNFLNPSFFSDPGTRPDVLVDRVIDASTRFGLNGRIFTYLLRSYVYSGKVKEASEAFSYMSLKDEVDMYLKDMADAGLKPNKHMYGALIRYACMKRDLPQALRIADEMKVANLVPTQFIYNTLIGACVKEGEIEKALNLKDEMMSHGIPLNVIGATSLMKGFCLKGELNSALDLFSTILESGDAPNKVTFSVLIEGCFKLGYSKKAHELYLKMKEMGIAPSVFNLNTVMRCLLKVDKFNEAKSLFEEAVQVGIPNVISFDILLHWLCQKGKIEEANNLWAKMLSCNLKPSVVSYNTLIYGLCIPCNEFIYNTLINGLSISGCMSEVNEMLSEATKDGFVPSCMTYNSIINGFVKAGNMACAAATYQEMCKRGIDPDIVTYSSFIDGYWFSREGNMEAATELFHNLKQLGLPASAIVYNSLISGYKDLGEMKPALDLFDEMSALGIPCDTALYTTLIDGLFKSGDENSALELYNGMIEKGILPDVITFTVLTHGLCRNGQGERESAKKVLGEMERFGVKPSAHIYNMLINSYFREGKFQEAFFLHDDMLEKGIIPDEYTYDILVGTKPPVADERDKQRENQDYGLAA
ncbi:hypothetical protein LUZ62_048801 [Rhynchospora pubera]|uniref:Pentatricopeptide repeat-containing protein n=1 Tax=Rhynchospora pubera TaxID=906938 RepID=A0AAV8FVN9_9POAL|nr:hypothetical protein LUZ62_048801 [Rhynchospora pubera]